MVWVPLHQHSQYSVLDASCSPSALAKRGQEVGVEAMALTDHGNLFGAVDFYKACKGQGIKPIIGAELYLAPESRKDRQRIPGRRVAYHTVLLAKNSVGYRNLCKLSSAGYIEGFYYFPRIDKELLSKHCEGLICLSGCLSSEVAEAALSESPQKLKEEIEFWRSLFGDDFYFEIQRNFMSNEEIAEDKMQQETWVLQKYQDFEKKQKQVNAVLIEASKEYGIPLVATANAHYLDREEWKAHEILLNVQSGEPCEVWEKDAFGTPKFKVPNPKRKTFYSHSYYFKSPEEMGKLFADLPEAIENTVKVAEKCTLEIDFKTKHYPVYIPEKMQGLQISEEERKKGVAEFLQELCEEGIKKRYTEERLAKVGEKYPDQDPLQVVKDRLDLEMGVICSKELADYLLIVWDFIHWGKEKGIPFGPGRGSGAGSVILYLIGITDIEPLRFDLFFERFINPERMSYPDIDVDICMDKRDEVIRYTLEKYGHENVAQIITFGTMKAKMAIKDVGRVLSVPLSKVNAIAKLVPDDLNMTIRKALEIDVDFAKMVQEDEETRQVVELAKQLEGSIRNTGIHAAGVIISGEPLTEHIPIFRAKDSEMNVTQFSMKPVEAVGMLKVDFLGLKTLTSIQVCVEAVADRFQTAIDWMNLPLEDEVTFNLLNQGKTLGVFQLESSGMQELARQLHLDCFEEIIAVVSLYRPGPMDMIPSFISRKKGEEVIEYDHPWMEDILKETYGIMVYQEQVMQIAQKLANYSLGEGDVLRRAMGKKDMEQMKKERDKFREGCLENRISNDISMRIFDKMEKFAAYGFNKSHAAAYGYVSYVTAYLKANYPGEWMAALMTCDRDDISKVSKFIGEAQTMGLAILPPDVNSSGTNFKATEEGIRFAMTGIKGVGGGVVDAIIEERKRNKKFRSLYDFVKRVDHKKVGKKSIENLIWAGAFDFTGWQRTTMLQKLDEMFDAASVEKKEKSSGIMTMFEMMGESNEERFAKEPEVVKGISKLDLLFKEKELLGFFLTGHPMSLYKNVLRRLSCISLNQIERLDHDAVFRAAFIVETVNVRISQKTQKKFAFITLSDGSVRYEVPIWADLYEQVSGILAENQLYYAVLAVDRSGEDLRIACKWMDLLTQVNEEMIAACDQAFDKAKFQVERMARLRKEKKEKKEMETEKQEVNNLFKLEVASDKARLSDILAIQRILGRYPGQGEVEISFRAGERDLGTLFVQGRYGVGISDKLRSDLKKISCIISSS